MNTGHTIICLVQVKVAMMQTSARVQFHSSYSMQSIPTMKRSSLTILKCPVYASHIAKEHPDEGLSLKCIGEMEKIQLVSQCCRAVVFSHLACCYPSTWLAGEAVAAHSVQRSAQ